MTDEPEATTLLERLGTWALSLRDLAIASISMYGSRSWLAIYALVALNLLLSGVPLAVGIAGHYWPLKDMTTSRYAGLAARESRDRKLGSYWTLPGGDIRLPSLPLKLENTSFQNLLFPKLALLGDESVATRFGLALSLVARHQVSQAKLAMEVLAKDTDFPLAHIWLAQDILASSNQLDIQTQRRLVDHLAAGFDKLESTPAVTAVYSQVLWGLGQHTASIQVLSEAIKRQPVLKFTLSHLLELAGETSAASELRNEFERDLAFQFQDNNLSLSNLNIAVGIIEISGDLDAALELVVRGRNRFPDDANLRRRYSDLALAKYRKSLKANDSTAVVNLSLLEQAVRADSSNPTLDGELENLLAISRKLNPNARSRLSEEQRSGKFPVVLNLLFGLEQIAWTNFDEAERYLTNSLNAAPDCPFIMARLAVTLTELSNPDFDRARALAQRSFKSRESDPAYWESLARVFLSEKQNGKAIEILSEAANLWPRRMETRQLLARALEMEGRLKEAELQRNLERDLRDKLSPRN